MYEEEEEDYTITSSKTLSSIFKKHKKIGQLRMKEAEKAQETLTAAVEEKKSIIINYDIEETATFNSKLCWLNQTPTIPTTTVDLLSYDNMDFPLLSADNNKLITKMCPKVVNGFKCSDKECKYQHPPEEETKKIVSDMRQLKKRVVKDVLKVIQDDGATEDKSKSRSRLCKFQEKCKFKDTTCKFIHTVDVASCQFGVKCKLIVIGNDKVVANNPRMKKKCGYLHTNESKDMYLTRHK